MPSEDELRSEAEYDKTGRMIKVSIPWSRQGYTKSNTLENTILGHLHISYWSRGVLEYGINGVRIDIIISTIQYSFTPVLQNRFFR